MADILEGRQCDLPRISPRLTSVSPDYPLNRLGTGTACRNADRLANPWKLDLPAGRDMHTVPKHGLEVLPTRSRRTDVHHVPDSIRALHDLRISQIQHGKGQR